MRPVGHEKMIDREPTATVEVRADLRERQALGRADQLAPFDHRLERSRAGHVVQVAPEEHDRGRAHARDRRDDATGRERLREATLRIVVHLGTKVRRERDELADRGREVHFEQITRERRGRAIRKIQALVGVTNDTVDREPREHADVDRGWRVRLGEEDPLHLG